MLSFVFFSFFGLNLQHTEVPRLGVKSELQLPAYTTATAMPDPSHVCDLHHSSQQHGIPNPLSHCGNSGFDFLSFLPSFFFFFFFCFLGSHLWHMEVPGLGVESELQLPAYTTATAMQDPSFVCDLHHRSQQRWILNPLSKARDRTCNLMVPCQIHFNSSTVGASIISLL